MNQEKVFGKSEFSKNKNWLRYTACCFDIHREMITIVNLINISIPSYSLVRERCKHLKTS